MSDAPGGGLALAGLLPETARVGGSGHLEIGGCDVVDLVAAFGTPLYVYDVATLQMRARAYLGAISESYPGPSAISYAAKAYCAPWLLRLLSAEGLGVDVVSGGELFVAARAGVAPERIYFHGNNKSEAELEQAVAQGIGRVVVDNEDEVELLARVLKRANTTQDVLLRVTPGVEAHTHAYIQTGALDSKFGVAMETGAAFSAAQRIVREPSLQLVGLHAHIGSQIFDRAPYRVALLRLVHLARSLRGRLGVELKELSPGGGFGARYVLTDDPPPIAQVVSGLAELVVRVVGHYLGTDSPLPKLVLEPGRSIVAPSAIAIYSVGSIKRIPGVRTYVAVDGGMADNIRPATYGAVYAALLANRADSVPEVTVAIAGRYCESGDVLIRDAEIPDPQVGDLVAIPAAGAYQLAMASNYNLVPRPAVVTVAEGQATLTRRRETYADLLACESDD